VEFYLATDRHTPEIKHLAQAHLLLLGSFERTNAWRSHERLSVEKTMYTTPRYCSSDTDAEIGPSLEGVTLIELEAYDMIHARTRNSDYEIFLLDPKSGLALVRGGECFAEPVEATVSGSTFGGSMLKLGWLGVGFRMEIFVNGDRAVTSPIQSLRVERIDSVYRRTTEFTSPSSFHPAAGN
jgi:hypothetical protein